MSSINIVVTNATGSDLFVTGSYGSDLSGLIVGQRIPDGASATVAIWNSGTGPVDNWDYVYLGTEPGDNEYQLYMESNRVGTPYQFMGFYSDHPNNEDSNPNPFTDPNCYLTGVTKGGQWVYAFLTVPS